ncbi:MAG: type II toxin-antitoxin system RelE/ParE family toxin [Dehalococcoidia bacterium]
MSWEVEYTDEFNVWWEGLMQTEQAQVTRAVEALEQAGPALGRPWVGTIATSRHPNLKELRTRGGFLRVLFAFDPRRTAILLLGGDKRNQWTAWYERAVPLADRLYDTYLGEIRREGAI